jgi:hypothetical protein
VSRIVDVAVGGTNVSQQVSAMENRSKSVIREVSEFLFNLDPRVKFSCEDLSTKEVLAEVLKQRYHAVGARMSHFLEGVDINGNIDWTTSGAYRLVFEFDEVVEVVHVSGAKVLFRSHL